MPKGHQTRRSAKRVIPSTKPYLDMLDVTEVCTSAVVRGSEFLPAPSHVMNVEILQGGERIAFLGRRHKTRVPTHCPDSSPFGQLRSDRRGDSRRNSPRVVGICPRIYKRLPRFQGVNRNRGGSNTTFKIEYHPDASTSRGVVVRDILPFFEPVASIQCSRGLPGLVYP